jgi:O-antigen ligase
MTAGDVTGIRRWATELDRRRPAIELWGAGTLLVLYVVLRSADAHRRWLELWYVAATAFAVAFPYGGLLLIIPVGMFLGPFLIRPGLPAWTIWIVGWAAGVFVRVVHALVRDRASVVQVYRNPALLATLVLLAASAFSVVTSFRHDGRAIGIDATYRWLWGPGTLLLVLLAAAWVVRGGRLRPLIVAVATGVAGAVLSLALWLDPSVIRDSRIDWMLSPITDVSRLHGITYWATGLEALLIIVVPLLVMAGLFARDRRVRLAAAISLVPVGLALWYTYNRAALFGAYVIAVVASWHARPRLGKALAVVGAIGGMILVPWYMTFRGSTLGSAAIASDGKLLSPSDQMRIDAWIAALRMWLDAPLLGHGFWSFFRLHAQYGSVPLDAPHNDWLRLFAEGGLVAGLAGIAFLLATAWTLTRGRGWLPRAALAAFLCWVLALCFNNIISYDQVSIPLAVVVATGVALVTRERAALPAEADVEAPAKASSPEAPDPDAGGAVAGSPA